MKKLLIVVDYQTDFVNGSLGFKKAVKLEKGIVNKIKLFIKNHDDIFFTMDTHDDAYLNTIEGKKLPIKHAIVNSAG
jgi:nicotinamidase-related amidase